MKVVAFNGSPRPNGNTARLIKEIFQQLQADGIETELVSLAGKKISGCRACYKCFKNKNKRCSITDDVVNECIEKMLASDGIILASPTYFADLTPELKALIDRSGMTAIANGGMFARKAGAAVVAVRRAGGIHTFDSINHFFLISQMIVPGSSYWNIGYGGQIGEAENDQEAMQTMQVLGRNMAWLLKKLHS